jgi:hypothetical protein
MTPSGIDPATFRFVGQCLNHCATAFPISLYIVTQTMNRTGYSVVDIATGLDGPGFEIRCQRVFLIVPEVPLPPV